MYFPFRVDGRYVTASYYQQTPYDIQVGFLYVKGHAAAIDKTHAKAIAFMLENGVKVLTVDGVHIYQEK